MFMLMLTFADTRRRVVNGVPPVPFPRPSSRPLLPSLCSEGFCCVWVCRTLQTVGPSHARTYTVAVYFKGDRIGCGKGPR